MIVTYLLLLRIPVVFPEPKSGGLDSNIRRVVRIVTVLRSQTGDVWSPHAWDACTTGGLNFSTKET